MTIEGLTEEDMAKAEAYMGKRIQTVQQDMAATKTSYWTKIAKFQIKYNGKSWSLVDRYDLGYGRYEPCQLCGFQKCRYKFVIESEQERALEQLVEGAAGAATETYTEKQERLSIGSECILRYVADLDKEKEKSVKKVRDLMIKEARLDANRLLAVELYALANRLSPNWRVAWAVRGLSYTLAKGGAITGKDQIAIETCLSKILVSPKVPRTSEMKFPQARAKSKGLIASLIYGFEYSSDVPEAVARLVEEVLKGM